MSVNGKVGQTDGLSFTRLDLRKIQFVTWVELVSYSAIRLFHWRLNQVNQGHFAFVVFLFGWGGKPTFLLQNIQVESLRGAAWMF